MAPTPVLLPGNSHGWRSLVGCRLRGHEESDTTEQLHFYFALSCIGEGNGNPLQCSCLENPRDRGAWWAAVYGVSQSQTRLKWLSSSSSRALTNFIVNLAILLPYFLYHRLIFLCPPLNQLFSSCLSLLINYGNLLIHIPCIFIWKLHFSILKIILWYPQMCLRLNFSPLWRVTEPRFIWVRKMTWNEILAPKCGGSNTGFKSGESQG